MDPIRALAHALADPHGIPNLPPQFGTLYATFGFHIHADTEATTKAFLIPPFTAHQKLAYLDDQRLLSAALIPLLSPLQKAQVLWASPPGGGNPTCVAPSLEIMRTGTGLQGLIISGLYNRAKLSTPTNAFVHHLFGLPMRKAGYTTNEVHHMLTTLIGMTGPFAIVPSSKGLAHAFGAAGHSPWDNGATYRTRD